MAEMAISDACRKEPPKHIAFTIFNRVPSISGESTSSEARLGRLSITGRRALDTPNFVALTSRGVIPHLTPDVVLKHTHIGGVHMAIEDYIEKAAGGRAPIMEFPSHTSTPLHTFSSLPLSIITLMAPRRIPAVSAPSGNTDSAVYIFTSVGFQSLSSSAYSKYVTTLQPDIAVALGDVPHGKLPGAKRLGKMGDRTSKWLGDLVSDVEEAYEDSAGAGPGPAIFAPILPIDSHSQSLYLNDLTDEHAGSISGLAFYSSSTLPDIPATTTLSRLPRLSLDEPASPQQVLRQISLGMDLFTIPFISYAADSGLALTFRFPSSTANGSTNPPENHANSSETFQKNNRAISHIQSLGIDLFSPVHSTSVTPLVDSCTCYTCTSHHRAYIQHLLSAKEMLGWVLLQIHNHHILDTFFAAIRESLKAGTFEEDCETFEKTYERELPEGTGHKPRARGYHFKSEGPGEKKKNRPAWGALGGANEGVKDGDAAPVPDETAVELVEKKFADPAEEL